MKKLTIYLFIACCGFSAMAQQNDMEKELQQTIEIFFEGFHAQDSIQIKSVVDERVILQSIGKNQQNQVVLHQDEFSNFLQSIVSIPAEMNFEEVIHSYEIKVDGEMANVWTPYSFYLNGNLSHVGVNSFQLYKKDGNWKIIYLIDTRRRN